MLGYSASTDITFTTVTLLICTLKKQISALKHVELFFTRTLLKDKITNRIWIYKH